jgi:hypothetical protein
MLEAKRKARREARMLKKQAEKEIRSNQSKKKVK